MHCALAGAYAGRAAVPDHEMRVVRKAGMVAGCGGVGNGKAGSRVGFRCGVASVSDAGPGWGLGRPGLGTGVASAPGTGVI